MADSRGQTHILHWLCVAHLVEVGVRHIRLTSGDIYLHLGHNTVCVQLQHKLLIAIRVLLLLDPAECGMRRSAHADLAPVIGDPGADRRGNFPPVADAIAVPVAPAKRAGIAERGRAVQDLWQLVVSAATSRVLTDDNWPVKVRRASGRRNGSDGSEPPDPPEPEEAGPAPPPGLHMVKTVE